MRIFVLMLVILTSFKLAFAQTEQEPSPFTVDGYLETYYVFDFNKPEDNTRPGFLYSFNRHNEVNLNFGFIRGSYNTDNVRANLAVMAGTYANANLSAEPGVLKNIFEANAGVKISSTKIFGLTRAFFRRTSVLKAPLAKTAGI